MSSPTSPRVIPDLNVINSAALSRKRNINTELNTGSPVPSTPYKRARSSSRTSIANREICSPQLKILLESPHSPKSDYENYFERSFLFCKSISTGHIYEIVKVQSRITNEFYAIKKSHHEYTGQIQRNERMTEVECLKKVKGAPNCLQLLESWEQSGKLFMVTPFYSNGTLKGIIESTYDEGRVFSADKIWSFLRDLVTGLNEIHKAGIVHLDIKPENIFVDENQKLIIGDFGIALFIDSAQSKKILQDGDGLYIAPEVLKGHFFQASDIFSLGVVILEMCTKQLFKLESLYDNGEVVFNGLQFHDGLGNELKDLIIKMLSRDPSQRPTAEEILKHPRIVKSTSFFYESIKKFFGILKTSPRKKKMVFHFRNNSSQSISNDMSSSSIRRGNLFNDDLYVNTASETAEVTKDDSKFLDFKPSTPSTEVTEVDGSDEEVDQDQDQYSDQYPDNVDQYNDQVRQQERDQDNEPDIDPRKTLSFDEDGN